MHGGERDAAVLVDDAVLDELAALRDLAPLHQPPALAAIEACRARWPAVPNVACFDTAFHATIPRAGRTYALPPRYRRRRAYGFHGLSYAWATARRQVLAPDARRVLIAHLGGGQSLCGTLDGRSVVTTMGFTPLDGLVMATRSGRLDPGLVLWLARHLDEGDDLEACWSTESGLLGLCGTSDMREVHTPGRRRRRRRRVRVRRLAHRASSPARVRASRRSAASDALVFTGGVGEHDPAARAALADGLAWLGAGLDDDATRTRRTRDHRRPAARCVRSSSPHARSFSSRPRRRRS